MQHGFFYFFIFIFLSGCSGPQLSKRSQSDLEEIFKSTCSSQRFVRKVLGHSWMELVNDGAKSAYPVNVSVEYSQVLLEVTDPLGGTVGVLKIDLKGFHWLSENDTEEDVFLKNKKLSLDILRKTIDVFRGGYLCPDQKKSIIVKLKNPTTLVVQTTDFKSEKYEYQYSNLGSELKLKKIVWNQTTNSAADEIGMDIYRYSDQWVPLEWKLRFGKYSFSFRWNDRIEASK